MGGPGAEARAELPGRKRTILRGAGLSVAAEQVAGLAMLGFSSVYREGFETVLFLPAIVLEAGVGSVLEGVLLVLAGVTAVGVLTLYAQRKLPHRGRVVRRAPYLGGPGGRRLRGGRAASPPAQTADHGGHQLPGGPSLSPSPSP